MPLNVINSPNIFKYLNEADALSQSLAQFFQVCGGLWSMFPYENRGLGIPQ